MANYLSVSGQLSILLLMIGVYDETGMYVIKLMINYDNCMITEIRELKHVGEGVIMRLKFEQRLTNSIPEVRNSIHLRFPLRHESHSTCHQCQIFPNILRIISIELLN